MNQFIHVFQIRDPTLCILRMVRVESEVNRHNGVDNQTEELVRGESEGKNETKDSRESCLRVKREGRGRT